MPKVTFRSESNWTGEGVKSNVSIRRHNIVVDETIPLGGTDQGPKPVELLIAGLGSCMTVLASMMAKPHEVDLKGCRAFVEADLDTDGYMEKAPVRPGFLEIRYRIEIDSPSPQENIDGLIEHIRRICPIRDTLKGVPVNYTGTEVKTA